MLYFGELDSDLFGASAHFSHDEVSRSKDTVDIIVELPEQPTNAKEELS